MISIIIPAYNRPQQLVKAIQSVLAQTFRDFELVVVDDGSTVALDEAKKLVLDNGHRFVRITHSGVAAARNRGVCETSGEWIAFLDSDDCWLSHKLAKQVEFLKSCSQYRLCQCEEIWFRSGVRVNPKKCHLMPEGDAFDASLERCVISPSSIMLERELFLEFGGFDERLIVCEDYDLWIRLTLEHHIGLIRERQVEKFGGSADQLSRSQPAMDRFRVFSLLKLLLEARLGKRQFEAVFHALRAKSSVLVAGARKRGVRELGLYERLSKFVNGVNFDIVDDAALEARSIMDELSSTWM